MLRIMADLEKRKRQQALSKFTRNVNTLKRLLDEDAQNRQTTIRNYQNLLGVSGKYVEKEEAAIQDDAEGLGYLDEPGERHSNILVKYSALRSG